MSKNVINQSSVYAEGNVTIGDNITNVTVDRPVFSEISFEDYNEDEYVAPRFTGKIAGEILAMNKGKIGVVTAFYGFDKTSFTKHLAYKIQESYLSKGIDLKVKISFIASDYYSISSTIRTEKDSSIFILDNISPKDVNHNLEELRQAAHGPGGKDIIILVNTNQPMKSWPGANPDYWFIIEQEGLQFKGATDTGLYNRVDLLRYLIQATQLRGFTADYRDRLKEVLDKQIPAEIKAPEQIDLFLDLFSKNKTKDEKSILELVYKTKRKETLVSQWFNALEDEKQLVGLGMTLLDGLYDAQFFGVMERLIRNAWKEYNEGLVALDYADLLPLMHFFNFSSGENPVLESKFQNQRFQTLRSVWETHQRRITAILPALVNIIEESVSGNFQDWELYATYEKRVRLRKVLSDVLSDIGRLSPQSVEYSLAQLAANGNIGVQIVVARALAGWCESYEDLADKETHDRRKELFVLLNSWYTDSRLIALIKLFRQKKDLGENGGQNTASTYIRSTIALTLGYVSVYDQPNKLAKDVLVLLRKLIKENNDLVVLNNAQTLRLLLRNHPKQVGERLFELDGVNDAIFTERSKCEQFALTIASGLSDAQLDYPEAVEEILNDWIHYIKTKRPQQAHTSGKLEYREIVIVTLCFTLSLLDYSKAVAFNVDRAAEVLFDLRGKEHHPFVRALLLEVILNLYKRFYNEMEARHSKSIPNVDIEREVKPIAEGMKEQYLKERSEQSGGDYWIKLGDYKMDTWVNEQERDLTDLEDMLDLWLNKSENDNIIMIAAQAFIELSKVDAWEREERDKLLENIKRQKNASTVTTIPIYTDKVSPGFWKELSNWLIGNRDQRKKIIDGIINKNPGLTEAQIKIFRNRIKAKTQR